MTPTELANAHKYYDAVYAAYGAPPPPDTAIQFILDAGLSDYGLAVKLSRSKWFVGSPIYRKHAPHLLRLAEPMLPEGETLDAETVRQAITQCWTDDTLSQFLRGRNGYRDSPEYKGKMETFAAAMAKPGVGRAAEAVRGGWTLAQFRRFLSR